MFEKLSKCPYCSANIKVSAEDVFVVCEYCGREMEVPRFTQEEKRLTQAVEEMRASTEAAEAALKEAMERAEESDAQMEERITVLAEQIAEDSVQTRMHRDELLSELRANAIEQREAAKAHLYELKDEQMRLSHQLSDLRAEQQAGKAASLQHCYALGENAQRAGRFDEAIDHYQKLLVMSEEQEAEVHWRIVMCRYGVEYVQEQASGTYLPTITHMIVDSLQEDADYLAAERYARSERMRAYYRDEARHIDDILDKYRQIYGQEKHYDVFISVKQGDENGRPTEDSLIASNLYHMLGSMGLHVFNSRYSLQEHAGLEYEPYIMAALMTSKILLVVGTNGEYMNSPWVRNEWRRYRWLQENEKGARRLIAYIVGMKTHEIPKELGVLQIINAQISENPMGQLRGIMEKTFADRIEKPKTVASAADPQEAKWLKRAVMYMNVGDFEQCDEFCEKVLDMNPESGMAYVYKLCAARQVRKIDDLAEQQEALDADVNYRFALEYCDEKIADRLMRANDEILERVRKQKAAAEEKALREKLAQQAAADQQAMREKMEREIREEYERKYRETLEKEHAEREAAEKERAEREAAEKAAREAKERAEREARERAEREAAEKERLEREAKEKQLAADREEAQNKESIRRAAQDIRSAMLIGTIVEGTVTSVSKVSAQVKLDNGHEGHIHVDHCSDRRVRSAEDVLSSGDRIRAKVLRVNQSTGKLTLSIRDAMTDAEKQASAQKEQELQAEKDRRDALLKTDKVWEGNRGDSARAEEFYKEGNAYNTKGNYKKAVASLKMAAELGHSLAMFNLGLIYENKYTGMQNYAEAFEWYRKAAEAGNTSGMESLAKMYELGVGVQKNLAEAEKWYRKSADTGRPVAKQALERVQGKLAKEKSEAPQESDYDRAIRNAQAGMGAMVAALYEKAMEKYAAKEYKVAADALIMAAERGHAAAAYQLSTIYYRGEGVAKDEKEGLKWLLKAGELGDKDACTELAMMYHFGTGMAKDMRKAAEWYRKAADLGDVDSMFFYGMRCYNGEGVDKDLAEAEKWFRLAAGKGQKEAEDMLSRLSRQSAPKEDAESLFKQGDRYLGQGEYDKAVPLIRRAAEMGHMFALYNLGVMYEKGYGVAKNIREAISCYEQAGEKGFADAWYNLGGIWFSGSGVEKDYYKARTYYMKAVDLNHVGAMNNVAVLYQFGYGVKMDLNAALSWYDRAAAAGDAKAKNNAKRLREMLNPQPKEDANALFERGNALYLNKEYDTALPLLEKAAGLGHAEAMLKSGVCYRQGYGAAKDPARARDYYLKAADKGNLTAMSNLGFMYEQGDGVPKNLAEAAKWYKMAVDNGHSQGVAKLERVKKAMSAPKEDSGTLVDRGLVHHNRGEYDQAMNLYRRAEALGNGAAMCNIGVLYEHGLGVKKDPAEAVRYYRKASEAGNYHGWNNLGTCYRDGIGVGKDPAEAFRCFSRSADGNDRDGIFNLGWCYNNAHGVGRDYAKARMYYMKAVDMGHSIAMNNIGWMYENGQDCGKDLAEASKWYKKAVDAGYANAQTHLDRVNKELEKQSKKKGFFSSLFRSN